MRTRDRPVAELLEVESGDGSRAATLAHGEERARIEFRSRDVELDDGLEPFFAAAVPLAMRRARSLAFPGPVSGRLLTAAPQIQAILSSWDGRLREIAVSADPSTDGRPPTGGTAVFFTGGADSFYTVLRHRGELDALVFIHGYDVELDDEPKRRLVSGELAEVASALDLRLIEVETNVRSLGRAYLNWRRLYAGAALASVALLLSREFSRVLIPATHSYSDLHPSGSHPLLDPLWSTERVEIVHSDPLDRVAKLRELARSDLAMRHLRVCFQEYEPGLNCGRCNKCLRTMAGLRIVGALERCATLPDDLPLRRAARVPITNDDALTFVRENLAAAEAAGDDTALMLTLRHVMQRGGRRMRRKERRAAIGTYMRAGGQGLLWIRRRVRRGARRLRTPSRS